MYAGFWFVSLVITRIFFFDLKFLTYEWKDSISGLNWSTGENKKIAFSLNIGVVSMNVLELSNSLIHALLNISPLKLT